MQTEDRRIKKTRKAINDALWELMTEKDFEAITINDIAEKADINRATFYKHYVDKYDWLEKMITELLQELIIMNDDVLVSHKHPSEDSFLSTFQYFDQNFDFFSILLRNKGTLFFQNRFKEIIIERFKIRNHHGNAPSPDLEFSIHFATGAIVSAIEWWIQNERPLTVAQMAERMYRIRCGFPEWLQI